MNTNQIKNYANWRILAVNRLGNSYFSVNSVSSVVNSCGLSFAYRLAPAVSSGRIAKNES